MESVDGIVEAARRAKGDVDTVGSLDYSTVSAFLQNAVEKDYITTRQKSALLENFPTLATPRGVVEWPSYFVSGCGCAFQTNWHA